MNIKLVNRDLQWSVYASNHFLEANFSDSWSALQYIWDRVGWMIAFSGSVVWTHGAEDITRDDFEGVWEVITARARKIRLELDLAE